MDALEMFECLCSKTSYSLGEKYANVLQRVNQAQVKLMKRQVIGKVVRIICYL